MATIQKKKTVPETDSEARGLLANGSSGGWDIDIDEALSGAHLWIQVEGRATYAYFEIPSLDIIDKMIRLLGTHPTKTKRSSNGSPKRVASLLIGGTDLVPVNLVKDDEFDDRYFLVIGSDQNLTVRLVIAGPDASEIAEALRQIKQDLDDEA